ncbi:hypothetical protein bpr_II215 (plasmid) [Butyrivibrio proteoclasticus B316]|uniref:Uncharacterized protein n=1 Tax=Butyrivibrio proteoclasticus (strain ATCC 51982 / DSM 14932 / B316) TaxID=515622 RepID=E0S421_BUTPB|nr:hypothetical protein bpr_II215 [Butyrivibrio proteoclasticus B316]
MEPFTPTYSRVGNYGQYSGLTVGNIYILGQTNPTVPNYELQVISGCEILSQKAGTASAGGGYGWAIIKATATSCQLYYFENFSSMWMKIVL